MKLFSWTIKNNKLHAFWIIFTSCLQKLWLNIISDLIKRLIDETTVENFFLFIGYLYVFMY